MRANSKDLPFRSTDKTMACIFVAEMHEQAMAMALGQTIELYFPVKSADVKVWQNYYHEWEVWITNPQVTSPTIRKMVAFSQAYRLGWNANKSYTWHGFVTPGKAEK